MFAEPPPPRSWLARFLCWMGLHRDWFTFRRVGSIRSDGYLTFEYVRVCSRGCGAVVDLEPTYDSYSVGRE